MSSLFFFFFFQAEDGIRDFCLSRGLGDVYKRQLSGIGGIIGGYIMYFIKRGNYNPVIGIAAVSCVPTTAKVAQKIVSKDNPDSFVLGDALGANISGVITSAIITGIYITVIPYL